MAENCSHIYTCPDCNFIFKKRSHLLRHKLVHSDERPFKCDICEKSFRSSFHLNRHTATHSGVKSYKCPYEGCQVACVLEWNLKRHIKRTHMGKFKCEKCGEEFRKNKALHQHTSTEHRKSVIVCEFPGCAQTFSVPSKMKHHLKLHTEKGYICPVKDCSMKFNLWSECRMHAAECKKKEVNCDVCGKIFRERSNLKAHKKIHSENREVFQCTYDGCGRFYTKQYNLKVHVQSFHLNIRPYVCSKDGCKKAFHFQHLLRKHYENMHEKVDSDEEKYKRKPKRPRRINNVSTVSAITGYIPELWGRMTPEEIKSYVEKDQSLSGNEDSSNESTQAEPKSITPSHQEDITGTVSSEDEECTSDTVPVRSSDEYEEITELIEIKPYMYKPVVKRVKRSSLNRLTHTYEEPIHYADASPEVNHSPLRLEQEECLIFAAMSKTCPAVKVEPITIEETCPDAPSQTTLASETTQQFIKLASKRELQCMEEFSDRFRSMFESSTPNSLNIHGLCRIQSINESDSSDSDAKNKQVPCVM